MLANEGKKFEQDFKESIPEWCWVYRLRDSAGTWQGGDNTRFTPSNICDFIVLARDRLFLLELKSHKGASIPISCIRENQLKELSNIVYPNIRPRFIFNFRDKERTYIVSAREVKKFIEETSRKSIPIGWCKEHGEEIESIKKRTRFRYNLEKIFS